MTETADKKNVQKLQRAVVDALEDVKAQELEVFDTEHLSSLFERVVIASGTSNRQTKALAASVRDKVREAGFPKPRIEGEDNGEWIIVDCGAVVVHVMQPTIRSYYNLEEIWGEKPVRLKLGAPKPVVKKAEPVAKAAKKTAAKKAAPKSATKAAPKAAPKAAGKTTSAKSVVAKSSAKPSAKSSAKSSAKPAAKSAARPSPKPAAKTAAKKSPAKKSPARKA
jgi:ribosome-associated protein